MKENNPEFQLRSETRKFITNLVDKYQGKIPVTEAILEIMSTALEGAFVICDTKEDRYKVLSAASILAHGRADAFRKRHGMGDEK